MSVERRKLQKQKQVGANPLELHYTTLAYQRDEILFDEWRKQALAWSYAILGTKKDAA